MHIVMYLPTNLIENDSFRLITTALNVSRFVFQKTHGW